jgi:hypothetical protein
LLTRQYVSFPTESPKFQELTPNSHGMCQTNVAVIAQY